MAPADGRLRVVLNGIPLFPPRTGVGRFTRQASEALVRLDPGIETAFFYGFRLGRLADALDARSAIRTVANLPGIRGTRARLLAHRVKALSFRALTAEGRFGLYHETNYVPFPFPGPVLTTIYDLSVLLFPETHPADRVGFMESRLPGVVSGSTRFVTISESVKREMVALLGVDPGRVDVVYPACSPIFHQPPPPDLGERLRGLGLEPGYWLYVGTIEPRKNLGTLVRAYRILQDRGGGPPPLVVVGHRGWHWEGIERLVEELRLRDRVRFLGFLPDPLLAAVYAGASLFVSPSLYEGFGIPPLEAMAQGVPALLSSIAPHLEVYRDCAAFADPLEPEAWAGEIERLRGDPAGAAPRVERGRRLSLALTWDRVAERLAAIYRGLAGRSDRVPPPPVQGTRMAGRSPAIP